MVKRYLISDKLKNDVLGVDELSDEFMANIDDIAMDKTIIDTKESKYYGNAQWWDIEEE